MESKVHYLFTRAYHLPISRVFFYVSVGFLSKSSPDRKISPFCQSPWEKSVPSMFPRRGPLQKQTPVSRALPNTSFKVPSKGAFPSGSSQIAHTERDAPFPDTSCICQSPWSVNPLQVSQWGPCGERCPFHILHCSHYSTPSPVSPNRAPIERLI
jgi:hypothetical protein